MDVRQSPAEQLPFPDGTFDAALAQLVVHFMADPVRGLREMGRVTRPGGMVAAYVWDHAGGRGPLTAFWSAVRDLDPAAGDESDLAGAREGHLASLFRQAGLAGPHVTTLTERVRHASFDDWWQRFTLGVGPAGALRGVPDPGPPGRAARAVPAPAARRPGGHERHRLGRQRTHLTWTVRRSASRAGGRPSGAGRSCPVPP